MEVTVIATLVREIKTNANRLENTLPRNQNARDNETMEEAFPVVRIPVIMINYVLIDVNIVEEIVKLMLGNANFFF